MLLNPVPEWVQRARDKGLRKQRRKRRDSDASSAEEGSSAEEMDVDEEELSAQPLAELLQNPDALLQTAGTRGKGGKMGKLRPEVLDIQRAPDIGGLQPVSLHSLKSKKVIICR